VRERMVVMKRRVVMCGGFINKCDLLVFGIYVSA